MDAETGYVCEGPIMARGLAAGAFWGMPLGVVILSLIAPPGWTGLLTWAGAYCIIGAAIGGLVGLLSGLVLAVGEQTADATDRGRRKASFITSAAPFLLLALFSGVAAPAVVAPVDPRGIDLGLGWSTPGPVGRGLRPAMNCLARSQLVHGRRARAAWPHE